MASINYEHSLDEKILVVYEHDSFNDIQESLLTWCCHQYINCTFKVYFNDYSHELTHIGFVKLSNNNTGAIHVIQHFTVDHEELSNQWDAVKFFKTESIYNLQGFSEPITLMPFRWLRSSVEEWKDNTFI